MTTHRNTGAIKRIAAAMLCVAIFAGAASACSVCFGDPDNPQAHGLNQAILTLLGVLGGVMATIVYFGARIAMRSRHAELAAGPGDLT